MARSLSSGWKACPPGELKRLSALLRWKQMQKLAVAAVATLLLTVATVAGAAGLTDGFRSMPFHTPAPPTPCTNHELNVTITTPPCDDAK